MGRKRKLSLRTKIILWSFVPTSAILFLVALILYVAYQQVTEEFAVSREFELTHLSAEALAAGFEEQADRLWALSRFRSVQDGDPAAVQAALAQQGTTLAAFDAGVYVLDGGGRLVAAWPEQPGWIGQSWSARSYFGGLATHRQATFSDIRADGPLGSDVIVLAVPVLDEAQAFGGVVAGMFRLEGRHMSPFFGQILKTRVGQAGSATIVDGSGRIVYEPSLSQIGASFSHHPVYADALAGQPGARRTRAGDGRDIVASFAPVPHTSWTLVNEEDWSNLARRSQGYRASLIGLLALGVVLPAAVVLVGVRRITGPLHKLISAAQKVAGGNFDQAVEVRSGDEIEELATQFSRMAAELKSSYALLEARVAGRTRELSAVNSVAAVVTRSLDLEQILPDALATAVEVMEMDSGIIRRLNAASGRLEQLYQQGLSPAYLHATRDQALDSSIVRTVVETGQPAVRAVAGYPPGPVRSALEQEGIRLVVSIPLAVQGQVLGALNLFRRSAEGPSEQVLSVASAIGQQIALAMHKAALYSNMVELARDREEARRSAEAANQAKSAFLASMSHELRTPLSAIIGFTRIVRRKAEGLLPGKQVENLDKVLISADHLLDLINSVLDIAKIEAGRMDVQVARVEVRPLVEFALSTAQPLLRPGVRLTSQLPADLPELITDQGKVRQILINLLSNAVKFTHQGCITVSARGEAGSLVLEVADTGIGIAPEAMGHIFQEFQQADSSTTRQYGGTGLGLSISRKLARLLEGDLTAASQLGVGSTFTLTLPLRYSRRQSRPPAPGGSPARLAAAHPLFRAPVAGEGPEGSRLDPGNQLGAHTQSPGE